MNQRQQSGVARAEAVLLLLAVAISLAGALRYFRHGSFSLAQAGYCLVSIPAALLLLLVFDYTLHHAKIAAVMVLIFVVLVLVASPAFCVGLLVAAAWGVGRAMQSVLFGVPTLHLVTLVGTALIMTALAARLSPWRPR